MSRLTFLRMKALNLLQADMLLWLPILDYYYRSDVEIERGYAKSRSLFQIILSRLSRLVMLCLTSI